MPSTNSNIAETKSGTNGEIGLGASNGTIVVGETVAVRLFNRGEIVDNERALVGRMIGLAGGNSAVVILADDIICISAFNVGNSSTISLRGGIGDSSAKATLGF